MRIATYSVTFVMEPTMHTASGLKWPPCLRMDGNARDVVDVRIVTAKLLGQDRAAGGTTTIQFVTPVINNGTRFV